MFRFIHCADIHLDSPMRGLRFADDTVVQSIRQATRRALENLVQLAVSERVDFVVIAGDIFDGDWEDYSTGLFFNRCMQRLGPVGIPVYMIRGNHDAESVITRTLTLPEHVTVFSAQAPETVVIEPLKVAIHGQSFATRDVTENLVANYPVKRAGYFNIGLLHTGLSGREGHARYAPCQLSDINALGYDYFALGHIHQPEWIQTAPWVVYAGNIQGRHIRETGVRGCMLVTVDDDAHVNVEMKPLDVMRWEEITVHIETILDLPTLQQVIAQEVTSLTNKHIGVPLCIRIRLVGLHDGHAFIYRDEEAVTSEIINSVTMAAAQDVYVERIAYERVEQKGVLAFFHNDTQLDGLHHILRDIVDEEETKLRVEETLRTWQRGIAAKMHAVDAPPPVSTDLVEAAMENALSELSAMLKQGEGSDAT